MEDLSALTVTSRLSQKLAADLPV